MSKLKRNGQNSILAFFGPATKTKTPRRDGTENLEPIEVEDQQPSTVIGPATPPDPVNINCTTEGELNSPPVSTSKALPETAVTIHPRDPCNDVMLAINHINDGPFQPNSNFAITKGRKFRPEWYNQYPWLEYSTSKDKAYCFVCRVFYRGTVNKADDAFTVNGFCNWKKANSTFENHSVCQSHVTNNVKFIAFKQSQQSGSVMEQIDSQFSKDVKENRLYIQAICESLVFCGRQGIAIRGHDEAEDSTNRGNFLELMALRAKDNELIKRFFNDREKNFRYVAPTFQNELLSIIGDQIKCRISEEVKKSGIFAIMADETQDITKHEQVAIVIRHVDDNLCIHESFLGFYRTTKTDGESLADLLKSTLKSLGLDMQDLRAQCYDGASSMRGPYKGVASRLQKENPKAIYIHCYAHVLNLCIVSCCTTVPAMRNMFFDLQSLYNFIERSYKRHAVFEKIQKEAKSFASGTLTLKSLSDTRWYCRVEAVRSLIDNFDTTIETLSEIAADDPAVGGEANALLKRIEDFHFVFTLLFLMRILTQCDILSRTLQSTKINYATVKELTQSTIEVISTFRSDEFFKKLWDHCLKLQENCNFSPPTLPRLSKVPQKLGGGTKEPYESVEQFYRVTIVNPVVDILVAELSSRLEENNLQILNSLSSVLSANHLNDTELNEVCEFYELDKTQLAAELLCFYKMETECFKNTEFEQRVLKIKEGHLKEALPRVFHLFKLLLTVPISSASCERSFSCLRRLKTYSRNTTGQERLSSLALLAIEREVKVDLLKVIDDFTVKKRRLRFK